MPTTETLSVKDMFLHADPVVQGVMILLFLASLFCWVIIFEKMFIIRRIRRLIWLFKQEASQLRDDCSLEIFTDFTREIVEAGLAESRDGAGRESRADFRERVERSMRAVLSGWLERVGARSTFLATVGATSPFVGLFGTVWGIMHSFIGIAAAGETSLAVVAPGIAEALFATAMGLVAAIPAVVAYNKITVTMKKITKEALAGIGLVGNRLARLHFNRLEGVEEA
ncbi:MAG: MotA/TolQ/ExbB proton channel family protein [Proteobacteria bacterium]|nr:MotA/TolQ/ExbB proton channel family protein [Pseudomonadota bacterium]